MMVLYLREKTSRELQTNITSMSKEAQTLIIHMKREAKIVEIKKVDKELDALHTNSLVDKVVL